VGSSYGSGLKAHFCVHVLLKECGPDITIFVLKLFLIDVYEVFGKFPAIIINVAGPASRMAAIK
jgi:hypothetical protein